MLQRPRKIKHEERNLEIFTADQLLGTRVWACYTLGVILGVLAGSCEILKYQIKKKTTTKNKTSLPTVSFLEATTLMLP